MNFFEQKGYNKIVFQRNIAIIGILLFLGKLVAWLFTNSDAVFSDAMESIVNVIAAFMGMYALYIASKPQDKEHPYGHGKVEFVTSGIEGAMIIFAGSMIIIEAVDSLLNGNKLHKLDYGIGLVAFTAVANYLLGYISYKKGVRENSLVLQSSGKHLQSDTITTVGVILSLILVQLTGYVWIDGIVALLFALYIIFVGYGIIRKSLRGIMDEADQVLLEHILKLLNTYRKREWIDVHNFRIQQHGSKLHIDGHLTLPYYLELRQAHKEMEEMIVKIALNTQRKIEFNVHMDDCKPFSCEICQIMDCSLRQKAFVKQVQWNIQNISQVQKHNAST